MAICTWCTWCTKYITLQIYSKKIFYSKSIKSKGNIFFFQFKHNSERLSGWKRCIHTSTLLDRCWRSGRSIKGPKLDELLYQLVKIIMEKQIIRWDVEIRLVSQDDIKSTYHYNSTLLSQSSFSDFIKEILVLWTNVTKTMIAQVTVSLLICFLGCWALIPVSLTVILHLGTTTVFTCTLVFVKP